MTFSRSVQKRIEAQTGEKLFTQAEVDARVAAALAKIMAECDSEGYIHRSEIAAIFVSAPQHLAEHDAALRDELDRCQKNYGKLAKIANEAGAITAKLEAENAELRDAIQNFSHQLHPYLGAQLRALLAKSGGTK